MTVGDNTVQAEAFGSSFKILEKTSVEVVKKIAINLSRNPDRAWDNTSNIATAAPSRNPKTALSRLSEVIIFYHTGKKLYFGKVV